MAFQTGTVTNPSDLVDTLIAFCVASGGFTGHADITNVTFSNLPDGLADGGGNPYTVRRLTRSGSPINWLFYKDLNDNSVGVSTFPGERMIAASMSYGVPLASTNYSNINSIAAGQPNQSTFNLYKQAAIFSIPYFFYSNGSQVYAVFEIFPNVFNHLSLGVITKYGTFTGGEYLNMQFSANRVSGTPGSYNIAGSNDLLFMETGLATTAKNYMRNEQTGSASDDFASWGGGPGGLSNSGNGVQGFTAPSFVSLDPGSRNMTELLGFIGVIANNQFNLRTPLIPAYVRLRDLASTSTASNSRDNVYNHVGVLDDIRLVNVTNLTPKSLVDTDWRVFPLTQKEGGDITVAPVSRWLGVAYREV